MASEIRVNKITHTAGVGTITTSADGIVVAGIITATSFSGSGANLTSLPAANLTGTLPAISGANLTGITGTTINNNADNRIITGSGTANTLNGESGFTFDGTDVQIPDKILLNTAGTYVKSNQLQFKPSGTAYIDHATTGQDIQIRMSTSSSLDTTGPTFKSNGNLAFASGKGIDFNATSDYSGATSEIFEDYEEGIFTPNIKGTSGAGTASYSTRSGKYTKVGNFVHITFEINWSSGSAGGELRVTDLPFSPTTDYEGIGSCMFHSVYLHGNEGLCVYVGPGVNYTYFYQSRSNDSWHSVNYDSAGVVIGNVSYRTS